VTEYGLGRHVEHDPQSRRFAFRAAAASLQSVRHPRHIPVLDQGQLGSCTGNAAAGALGTGRNYVGKVTGEPLDETFALGLYATATELDNVPGTWPPDDTGSTGVAVAKACQRAGLISGYQHTFSLADALAALQVGPIIVGTNWYEAQFEPAGDGRLTVAGGLAGGHEYVVDEIDVEQQRVWLTNSWGASWGVQGRAYYTWADFGALLAQNGDVVLFTPVTLPAPTPAPPPTPGAASFLDAHPSLALRVDHAAARSKVTREQWLIHTLDRYFGIKETP
jgi:hypothetical protein